MGPSVSKPTTNTSTIKSSYDLSNKFSQIEIYDQGSVGLCGVSSFCTVLQYYLQQNSSDFFKKFKPSRYYLYYYSSQYYREHFLEKFYRTGGGTRIEFIIESINSHGMLAEITDETNNKSNLSWFKEKIYDDPYDDEQKRDEDLKQEFLDPEDYEFNNIQLTEQKKTDALKWKNVITATKLDSCTVNTIKTHISNNTPLILCVNHSVPKLTNQNTCFSNNHILRPGMVEQYISTTTNEEGGHAVVVTGYNDTTKTIKCIDCRGNIYDDNGVNGVNAYPPYFNLGYDLFDNNKYELYNIKLGLTKYGK